MVEEYNRKISDNGTFLQDKLKENKTKINIFTELKNKLSGQQQSELNQIIKSYLPDNDNANFEEIIDKIINIQDDKDLLRILFRLTQDSRINSDTRSYIEQTIQELKKLLNITDTDYNAWIAEIPAINPEPDNRENINNYLIIKIEESKGQANTYHEYKFAAWFLQLNTSQSQGNNYIHLPLHVLPGVNFTNIFRAPYFANFLWPKKCKHNESTENMSSTLLYKKQSVKY